MQGYKVPHTIHVSNLKKIRIKQGIKQAELAEKSRIPLKTIGNFEQLRRNINTANVSTVYALASALGCRIEDLIDKEYL